MTLTTPPSGVMGYLGLGLAMVDLCAKFEDIVSFCYEDRKRDTQFRQQGGLG